MKLNSTMKWHNKWYTHGNTNAVINH